MNYLAHLFLSGSSPRIIVGNMCGDSIKGVDVTITDPEIRLGLALHQEIDCFNDSSSEFAACRKLFGEQYARYSHVLTDIAFDHLLALNWEDYSMIAFDDFVGEAYGLLDEHRALFVGDFEPIFDKMQKDDWLRGYRTLDGIRTAYGRIETRLKRPDQLTGAVDHMSQHRCEFNHQFKSLFPKLIGIAEEVIGEKIKYVKR